MCAKQLASIFFTLWFDYKYEIALLSIGVYSRSSAVIQEALTRTFLFFWTYAFGCPKFNLSYIQRFVSVRITPTSFSAQMSGMSTHPKHKGKIVFAGRQNRMKQVRLHWWDSCSPVTFVWIIYIYITQHKMISKLKRDWICSCDWSVFGINVMLKTHLRHSCVVCGLFVCIHEI